MNLSKRISPEWLITGFACSMLVVIFVLRTIVDVAADFQGLPLVIPIALVAMEFGRRGGFIMAVLSGLVIFLSSFFGGPPFNPVEFLIPFVCFMVIALLIGDLATRRRNAELELEQMLVQAEGIARTDPLTGLANRRAWDEEFRREVGRSRRRESDLAMMLIDLDGFKQLNDTQGHQAGDTLLKELSLAWQSGLRGGDLAARHGGDEFAILLPDCPADFAEDLFARFQGLTRQDAPWSAGIAYWDGDETPDEMTARADRALYAAKAMGGNQSVTAALPGHSAVRERV